MHLYRQFQSSRVSARGVAAHQCRSQLETRRCGAPKQYHNFETRTCVSSGPQGRPTSLPSPLSDACTLQAYDELPSLFLPRRWKCTIFVAKFSGSNAPAPSCRHHQFRASISAKYIYIKRNIDERYAIAEFICFCPACFFLETLFVNRESAKGGMIWGFDEMGAKFKINHTWPTSCHTLPERSVNKLVAGKNYHFIQTDSSDTNFECFVAPS